MKEIVKQYGNFFLAGIVFLVMLILIFSGIQDGEGNQGIVKIIAAHMDTEGTDYSAYNDFDNYNVESAKDFPQIAYHDVGYLPVGTVAFLDNVTAVDYAGRLLAVKIVKVEDEAGNDLSGNVDVSTGMITFPDAGIYKVTVLAKDDGNRNTTMEISVPVM